MAVLVGDLVNRDNVGDTATLNLNGVAGVHTLTIGARTFVYAAAGVDGGISSFELMADGTLSNVENITDNAMLTLSSASDFTSVTIGANTFLYVNDGFEDGISVFQVAADGTLSFVQSVTDDGTLNLNGAMHQMSVANVDGVDYLVASGFLDGGISIFSIAANGMLSNTDNVDDGDAPTHELSTAQDTTTAEIGGKTFVFVAGGFDDGVMAFELMAGGLLSATDAVDDTLLAALELEFAAGIATADIGGTTYLFVSGAADDGISVFSVDAMGKLTNVFNLADTASLSLGAAYDLNTFALGGETFLSVSSESEDALSVFHVASNGALTEIDATTDTGATFLDLTGSNDVTGSEAAAFLISGGRNDDGISSFELGGGADTLNGTAADDTIFGLGGDDNLTGGDGADTIFGGDGDDTIVAGGSVLTDGVDTVFGGAGDDQITGGFFVDILNGGAGNDTFFIGGGGGFVDNHDVIDGGTDTDTLDLSGFNGADGFNVNLLGETYDRISSALGPGPQSITNVENVVGTVNDDVIIGNSSVNTLTGGVGEDNLIGAAGLDVLYGGDDNDLLSGFAGGLTVGDETSSNYLYGEGGDDLIWGAAGADLLVGGAGADRFSAGAGDDWIYVDGDDTYVDGGTGFDRLFINSPMAAYSLNLATAGIEVAFGGGEIDILLATGATSTVYIYGAGGTDTLFGGSAVDLLSGGADADYLYGDASTDYLYSGTGADLVNGGTGNDILIIGDGVSATGDGERDTLVFNNFSGIDRVYQYDVGVDVMDLSTKNGLTSLNQLTFTDFAGGVGITYGTDTIYLIGNYQTSQLSAADFIL